MTGSSSRREIQYSYEKNEGIINNSSESCNSKFLIKKKNWVYRVLAIISNIIKCDILIRINKKLSYKFEKNIILQNKFILNLCIGAQVTLIYIYH